MKNRRVYFHYEQLEEYKSGMWKIVRGEQRITNAVNAKDLMKDREKFKSAMLAAVKLWPKSCLHNLTAEGVNKLAWLGHAGACVAIGVPEENTRIGWHMLNQAEQDEANKAAQEVLDYWNLVHEPLADGQLRLFDA